MTQMAAVAESGEKKRAASSECSHTDDGEWSQPIANHKVDMTMPMPWQRVTRISPAASQMAAPTMVKLVQNVGEKTWKVGGFACPDMT